MRIDGAAPNDAPGLDVADAGDVNGDGIADVIVGAPDAGNGGKLFSGSAYVVFGRASPGTVDAAGAGDVNGDGLADVILGFSADSNNGRARSGSAYVVFGKKSTRTVDLANLGAADFASTVPRRETRPASRSPARATSTATAWRTWSSARPSATTTRRNSRTRAPPTSSSGRHPPAPST
ncbi:MAG TPA: integrin alpha [Gaiellaceae bacterium]|nr:integrin alpha [Gaiellaceae bacterium]